MPASDGGVQPTLKVHPSSAAQGMYTAPSPTVWQVGWAVGDCRWEEKPKHKPSCGKCWNFQLTRTINLYQSGNSCIYMSCTNEYRIVQMHLVALRCGPPSVGFVHFHSFSARSKCILLESSGTGVEPPPAALRGLVNWKTICN